MRKILQILSVSAVALLGIFGTIRLYRPSTTDVTTKRPTPADVFDVERKRLEAELETFEDGGHHRQLELLDKKKIFFQTVEARALNIARGSGLTAPVGHVPQHWDRSSNPAVNGQTDGDEDEERRHEIETRLFRFDYHISSDEIAFVEKWIRDLGSMSGREFSQKEDPQVFYSILIAYGKYRQSSGQDWQSAIGRSEWEDLARLAIERLREKERRDRRRRALSY